MDTAFWLKRWEENQIGFHQPDGFEGLRTYWPALPSQSRVLVPFCGKSLDMLWLCQQGYDITGVEISDVAAEAFFNENGIAFERATRDTMAVYQATDRALSIVCHDFHQFTAQPFDALYDRAALVALPQPLRRKYVTHCQKLLSPNGHVMLVTMNYDQQQMKGPPFAVSAAEVSDYWADRLTLIRQEQLIDREPRFKERGLTSLVEMIWQTGSH